MSLGASTILPKKAHAIESVSAGTVVDLKATLFRADEDRKYQSGQGQNVERRTREKKGLFKLNAGVNERAVKDREQVQKEAIDEANSVEALTRKAAIYQEMVSKASVGDEPDERYMIDFEAHSMGKRARGWGYEDRDNRPEQPRASKLNKRLASLGEDPCAFIKGLSDTLTEARPPDMVDEGTSELFQLIEEGKGLAERETHSTKLELLKSKGSSKAEMIRRMRAEAKLKAARQKEAR